MSLKIPKRIKEICDQIERIYLNKSDEHQTVSQTIQKIRKENQEFYKDAEVIYKDSQLIKVLRKKIENLDKELKQLNDLILLQERKNKQNSEWKWYHYPTAPIWGAWKLVKVILKSIIYTCTIGFVNLFQSDQLAKKRQQAQLAKRKIQANKQKMQKDYQLCEDAIARLQKHVLKYVQTKGKEYEKFLILLQREFKRMSSSNL